MDIILEGAIVGLLTKYSDPIIKSTTKIVKSQWEKFKIDFDFSYSKYLKNSIDKYCYVKTLICRKEPIFINDFFVMPDFIGNKQVYQNLSSIYDFIDISNFLLIEGLGGTGKSSLLRYIFFDAIKENDLIPIYIELRDLNKFDLDYTLEDIISKKLQLFGNGFNPEYINYALKSGCFLFLFDGFDEIQIQNNNNFIEKLDEFCDSFPENYYILTSRPISDFYEFQKFTILTIQQFNENQIKNFTEKISCDEKVKEDFNHIIFEFKNNTCFKYYKDFITTPLLLSIMYIVSENYKIWPKRFHLFYQYFYDVFFSNNDGSKLNYQRELKCHFSSLEFKNIISLFCFSSYIKGLDIFYKEDLEQCLLLVKETWSLKFNIDDFIFDITNNLCILYKEGLEYRYVHRSFQEYFAACAINDFKIETYKKISDEIINNGKYPLYDNNIFFFLYDMDETKFESELLIPILEDFESICTTDNKFDYYIKNMQLDYCFRIVPEIQSITLTVISNDDTRIINFILFITNQYIVRHNKFDNSYRKDKELLAYLISNGKKLFGKPYKIGGHIDYNSIFKDINLYNLFKQTSIGQTILQASKITYCYDKLPKTSKILELLN